MACMAPTVSARRWASALRPGGSHPGAAGSGGAARPPCRRPGRRGAGRAAGLSQLVEVRGGVDVSAATPGTATSTWGSTSSERAGVPRGVVGEGAHAPHRRGRPRGAGSPRPPGRSPRPRPRRVAPCGAPRRAGSAAPAACGMSPATTATSSVVTCSSPAAMPASGPPPGGSSRVQRPAAAGLALAADHDHRPVVGQGEEQVVEQRAATQRRGELVGPEPRGAPTRHDEGGHRVRGHGRSIGRAAARTEVPSPDSCMHRLGEQSRRAAGCLVSVSSQPLVGIAPSGGAVDSPGGPRMAGGAVGPPARAAGEQQPESLNGGGRAGSRVRQQPAAPPPRAPRGRPRPPRRPGR